MNEETRQKILDAALQAILESGYRASVDDIARRAGVVKQTIYHHFAGKDALFAETVRCMAESVRVSLDEEPADLRSCLLCCRLSRESIRWHRNFAPPRSGFRGGAIS